MNGQIAHSPSAKRASPSGMPAYVLIRLTPGANHDRTTECVCNGPEAVRPCGQAAEAGSRRRRGPALADARVLIPHPGPHGRRHDARLPGLPRAAQRRPRPEQGRHPLRGQRDHGHRPRAGHLDDLEMRRGGYPAGRRQGRHHRRSLDALGAREGTPVPRLGGRDVEEHRPAQRRARAGRRHHAPDDGLDDG